MSHTSKTMRHAQCYFVLLLFCYALAPFHRTAPSVLAVDMISDLAVSGGLISVMGAMFFYPYAVMQIPAGVLADRLGARTTITVFLGIAACGTALFALAQNLFLISLGRALVGLGTAMVFVPALRVILDWFPRRLHPFCTGTFLSLGTCGMFLATGPLALLTSATGWRWAMMLMAVLTAMTALLCAVFLRNKPEDAGLPRCDVAMPSVSCSMSIKKSFAVIFRSRSYWCISIWFFCLYGVFYTFSGLWAGPYLMQGYGFDKEHTAAVLMSISAGAILGPTIYGIIMSVVKYSKKTLMIIACLAALLLNTQLIIPKQILSFPIMLIWGFLFSIFVGGVGSLGLLKIQEDFDADIVGTATGMVNIYTALGGGILQTVSGIFMNFISISSNYNIMDYSHMFILFFIILLVALLAALFCPKKQIT